ncbi:MULTISPECIES: LysR family transcriptional regulator [unclassified Undibacterium]|uniref:LysR family transcriptional regulator n=1 Tax=unclassified Undibacterium TaxID=2630295 RepID=UPI002AC98B29|nr:MULTISPECIES: LysR family transcriptional regulator [unclassified Undibacterium]MEB0139667.1 LysR family transcriptional regulator [Undibacterium sp. CCC2.1]MEB0172548.1 LysR family transcriptional regulator [Undibacterium sp. CCC1.1]MEB0176356.1 LysR family transcriptional regulator [Undibacterium sp. CCC3.4]MEB0215690.1 LysR family transcriptional regulator [Undibacterium sp. 5I2]WPX42967.1 LysR family transcriptional regulator [Undibacterium sp. CCC3.4]
MLNIDALIAFVAVIDAGSFTAAAERLGQTPSGISRAIARLESQLSMALITRTTRRLDLTEEGEWLLVRARKVLSDLQDTEEQLIARLSQPAGLVRVSAATPVLNHLLAPLAAAFMDRYPLVRLELISGETVIDLIEARIDLAIRIGPLADSTLNARRLGSSRLRLLASPDYLARHGTPANSAQLSKHRLLGFSAPASLNIWPLPDINGAGFPIQTNIVASSGETLRHLSLGGAGIVCLAEFLTRSDVASGRLVPLLETELLPWHQPVWTVFYKQGALAPRIAALVDFLALGLRTVLDD